MNKKILAIVFAILAAVLYAINIPISKLLLNKIEPTMMAAYLYLGAEIGVSLLYMFTKRNQTEHGEKYTKKRYSVCSWNGITRWLPLLVMQSLFFLRRDRLR